MGVTLTEAQREKLVIGQQYDEQGTGLFTYTGTASELVIRSSTFWLPTCIHYFLIIMCEFYKRCPEGKTFASDFEEKGWEVSTAPNCNSRPTSARESSCEVGAGMRAVEGDSV